MLFESVLGEGDGGSGSGGGGSGGDRSVANSLSSLGAMVAYPIKL